MSQILNVQFGGQQLAVDFGESTALALGSANAAGISASAAAADRVLGQAARVGAEAAAAGLLPLLTQHPVSRFIGVATPAAGAGNNFGSHFALAKVLPANTVIEGFDLYLTAAATLTVWAATATNVVGGLLTNSSVVTLGASITRDSSVVGSGGETFTATDLAPLGNLSGKFIVLGGQCEYSSAAGATGDEQWVAIDPGTLAASLAQQATRKIQMKVRYHTSDDHSADTLDYTGAQIIAALANQPSANTLALRAAIRNNGFLPGPAFRLAANDVPTVTVGAAGSATTIAGSVAIHRSSPKFTYACGPLVTLGYFGDAVVGRGVLGGFGWLANEFRHAGDVLEIEYSGNGSSGQNTQIIVNGQVAAVLSIPNTTGDKYPVRVAFPASATRTIRIEGSVPFLGVRSAAAGDITPVGKTFPMVTVISDSFGEGAGAAIYGTTGENQIMSRMLGWSGAHAPLGSTGLIKPNGAGTRFADSGRLTDLTLAGVTDIVTGTIADVKMGVVVGSMNDRGQDYSTVAGAINYKDAVLRQVYKQIDAWVAARTGRPLLYFGPTWPSDAPTLDIYRLRDAMQETVAAAGGTSGNFWFIDRLGPGPILRKGSRDFLATTGNVTSGSNVITNIPTTVGVGFEAAISGAGIPAGTTVLSTTGTTVTLSHTATATPPAGSALLFRNDQAALYTFDNVDQTHPPQDGHNVDGLWMTREARGLILSELA